VNHALYHLRRWKRLLNGHSPTTDAHVKIHDPRSGVQFNVHTGGTARKCAVHKMDQEDKKRSED
jgi:hypothetical protein